MKNLSCVVYKISRYGKTNVQDKGPTVRQTKSIWKYPNHLCLDNYTNLRKYIYRMDADMNMVKT